MACLGCCSTCTRIMKDFLQRMKRNEAAEQTCRRDRRTFVLTPGVFVSALNIESNIESAEVT